MVPEGLVFRRRGFEHLGRQCQRLVHGLFHVLKLALQVVNFYFIAHGSDITPEKLWCEEEIWCNNTVGPGAPWEPPALDGTEGGRRDLLNQGRLESYVAVVGSYDEPLGTVRCCTVHQTDTAHRLTPVIISA